MPGDCLLRHLRAAFETQVLVRQTNRSCLPDRGEFHVANSRPTLPRRDREAKRKWPLRASSQLLLYRTDLCANQAVARATIRSPSRQRDRRCSESERRPDTIVVYFEGNLYGDDYFARFAMRCLHAHGRMAQQYPTVAKARILLRDLLQVGVWHPREKVVEVADLASLAEWCSWSLPISAEELRAE